MEDIMNGEMGTCAYCGETYFYIDGHVCKNFILISTPDPMIGKLDRVIELLEKLLKKME